MGGSSNNAASIIVFSVIGLSIGGITEIFLKNFKIPIPYTVLLFFIGLTAGSIVTTYRSDVSDFLQVSEVSSNLIVYGFLPVLLFSESLSLNRHHLYQCFSQAAWLAGPGSILVCCLLALGANLILPYNWSWNYCFLFGAIMCATDPVSVVSLLKSTNASTKLTMIISGESLLNDGSAMIIYVFIYNMINGEVYTGGTFIAFCLKMLVLSPLIGVVLGLGMGRFMRRINRPTNPNMDMQLVISFICAYLSFFIAGYLSKVSGVLACASAGVMMAYVAPLSVLSHENFHMVWSYAEWACNTLIFVLAGYIGGVNTVSTVSATNFLYLGAMYLLLIVTRGIMAVSSVPMLNRLGEKCSVFEGIFMTYAGLRGSLSIALALEGASNAGDRGDDDLGRELFFMVTWLASLTLLINGSTSGKLLLWFKLIDDPNAPPSAQLTQVLTRIKLFMSSLLQKEFQSLKSSFGTYDEKMLKQLCQGMHVEYGGPKVTIDDDEDEENNNRDYVLSLSMRASQSMMIDRDLIRYIRKTFLDVVRGRYEDSVHHGRIGSSSSASKLLLHCVDMAYDDIDTHLSDWDAIVQSLQPNTTILAICQAMDDFFYIFHIYPGLVSRHDAYYERIAIYVLTNFIDAHEYAESKISFFLGQDLKGLEYDVAAPEQTKVLMESNDAVESAKKLLSESFKREDLIRLTTHRAAQMIVFKQAEIIDHMIHEGVLSEKNASFLLDSLQEDKDRIKREQVDYDRTMVKNNIHQKIEDEREMRASSVSISNANSRPIRILDNGDHGVDAIAMVETSPQQAHSPTRSALRHTLTNDEGWLNRPSLSQKTRPSIANNSAASASASERSTETDSNYSVRASSVATDN